MCAGDMTVEWPREEADGARFAVDGWGVEHQCKDWVSRRSVRFTAVLRSFADDDVEFDYGVYGGERCCRSAVGLASSRRIVGVAIDEPFDDSQATAVGIRFSLSFLGRTPAVIQAPFCTKLVMLTPTHPYPSLD